MSNEINIATKTLEITRENVERLGMSYADLQQVSEPDDFDQGVGQGIALVLDLIDRMIEQGKAAR